MDFDQDNKDELLIQRNQLSSKRHDHHMHDQKMSANEINEHFQLLLVPDKLKDESILLKKFFIKNPFNDSYNPESINLLLNFFNPESEYGVEGVNAAARIIGAFLKYEYDFKKNHAFDFILSNEFYQIIWPFFESSPYVIQIFQFAILLERKSPIPTAYFFLIGNNFFNLVTNLLNRNFEFKIELLCLINSLDSYHKRRDGNLKIDSYEYCIQSVSDLMPKICQMVFTTNDIDLIEYGRYCMVSYGKRYVDIGIKIFQNLYFQRKCKTFKQLTKDNSDEMEEILKLIDGILQNESALEEEQAIYEKCSKIRSESKTFNPMFIELIFKVLNSPFSISAADDSEDTNITPNDYEFFKNLVLLILSHLYLSENDIVNFIENGFAQRLFDMFATENSFKSKIRIVAVISSLIEFSNLQSLRYFIDNDYLNIITDYMDEFMTEIPHQIISSLQIINYYSETKEECAEWSSLLFDNDEIVKALEKAANGEYIDPEDSNVSLIYSAQGLLARRYNDCIPDETA